jgi:hypothetical protein
MVEKKFMEIIKLSLQKTLLMLGRTDINRLQIPHIIIQLLMIFGRKINTNI